MDEKPTQLIEEVRTPLPPFPGCAMRFDYEYQRNGTAVNFLSTEPLTGWRKVNIRERKTAVDWAFEIKELLEVDFPVVQENSNEAHAAFLRGPARFLPVLFERALAGASALSTSGKAGVKSCSIRSSIFFFRIGSGCTGSQIYSR